VITARRKKLKRVSLSIIYLGTVLYYDYITNPSESQSYTLKKLFAYLFLKTLQYTEKYVIIWKRVYWKYKIKESQMFFENLLNGYESVLHFVAEFVVHTLELIGISIIIVGSIQAILRAIPVFKKKEAPNVIIGLGRALALALEFKMGAEIVNTVIIRDLKELLILGIVIALRAILAVLIHWEIKNEEKDEKILSKKHSEE
jgi:uncharacterized membrane protein